MDCVPKPMAVVAEGEARVRTIDGVVTIVQESRFQLVDDAGVAHLVVLGYESLAEPDQLQALAAGQRRVRVRYTDSAEVIGLIAHDVTTL